MDPLRATGLPRECGVARGAVGRLGAGHALDEPDGLTLGVVSPGLYIQQLSGQKEIKFEWFKYSWIGSPEKTDRIFYIRADTPYKTLLDLRDAKEPPKCGATGLGTAAYYFPRLLQEAFGLKLVMVPGYQGAADANLAIERVKLAVILELRFQERPPDHESEDGHADENGDQGQQLGLAY